MTARNFSEDGAVGANTNGTGSFGSGGGSFGSDTGGGMAPPPTPAAGIQAGAGGLAGVSVDGSLSPSGLHPPAGNNWTADGRPDAGNPFGSPVQNPSGANWDASGITAFGQQVPTSPSAVGLAFADGGAIPGADGDEDDTDPNATDPQGSALGQSMQTSINAAMQTVQAALSYGRNLHGLGGGDQQAAAMPMQPGNQSNSGAPRQQPMPGPLPPTANPFGKRADAGGAIDEGSDQTAAMPSVPFSETPKPQPMPGPLPPTSNPFGKRGQQADAGDDASPAIDTEEDA